MSFETELTVAVKASEAAGKLLMKWFQQPTLTSEWKGRIDPVTIADKQSEKVIIDTIRAHFPDAIIVSEESNPFAEVEVINKRRWYIDPLDGTVNFIRGFSHWCVAIACVEENNETVCSAVYAPCSNELYTAIQGEGAWCNGERLTVGNNTELHRSVVASGFPYSFEDPATSNLVEWARITPQVLTVRSLGAAAKDICEVAGGRIDIFWEQGLERWDITASALICREAGAKVTDRNGKELTGPGTSIIVANPVLHEKVRALLS